MAGKPLVSDPAAALAKAKKRKRKIGRPLVSDPADEIEEKARPKKKRNKDDVRFDSDEEGSAQHEGEIGYIVEDPESSLSKKERQKLKKKRLKTHHVRKLVGDAILQKDAELADQEIIPDVKWSEEDLVPFPRKLLERVHSDDPECRGALGITVAEGVDRCPPPVLAYTDPRLPSHFKTFSQSPVGKKYSNPTAVQSQAWPAWLAGYNVVCQAKTGSGKTLAYCLPLVCEVLSIQQSQGSVLPSRRSERGFCAGLVLVPTRELVDQVARLLRNIAKVFPLRCTSVYGGVSKGSQVRALEKGTDILVTTPGRAIDLMEDGSLHFRGVTSFVLDEADRMLGAGFRKQLNTICAHVRPDRHMMVLSATYPDSVKEAVRRWVGADHIWFRVGMEEGDVSRTLVQHVQVTAEHKKARKLIKLLSTFRAQDCDQRNSRRSLVIVNKVASVTYLVKFLRKEGFRCEGLFGAKEQVQRQRVLDDFRAGKVSILVATDVAGRGLDIKGLKTVINYDFPSNLPLYIHRIGRAGHQTVDGSGEAHSYFTRNLAPLAPDLVRLLEQSGQKVDQYLKQLADEEIKKRSAESSEDENEGSKGSEGDGDSAEENWGVGESDDDDAAEVDESDESESASGGESGNRENEENGSDNSEEASEEVSEEGSEEGSEEVSEEGSVVSFGGAGSTSDEIDSDVDDSRGEDCDSDTNSSEDIHIDTPRTPHSMQLPSSSKKRNKAPSQRKSKKKQDSTQHSKNPVNRMLDTEESATDQARSDRENVSQAERQAAGSKGKVAERRANEEESPASKKRSRRRGKRGQKGAPHATSTPKGKNMPKDPAGRRQDTRGQGQRGKKQKLKHPWTPRHGGYLGAAAEVHAVKGLPSLFNRGL
eukprot:Rmarinus@m.7713